jgi:hypothetical protein
MPLIILDDFISNLSPLNSGVENYEDALNIYKTHMDQIDSIMYNMTHNIIIYNINMLKLNINGKYYYDFKIDKLGDIVNNIRVEGPQNIQIKKSYIISGVEYSPIDFGTFVFAAAPYTNLVLRIIFCEKPNIYDKFTILMRYYLLNPDYKNVLKNNIVISTSNIYKNGICIKRKNTYFFSRL